MTHPFDDIRCYHDSEINDACQRLLANEHFQKIIPIIFPNVPVEQFVEIFGNLNSIDEQQEKIILPFYEKVLKPKMSKLEIVGLEQLDKSKEHTFISNHRDIILDSALLNIYRLQAGMSTTEIAIGDNLFVAKWVEIACKINRTFVVKRNLPPRELLQASAVLSAYIRHTITEKPRSIWIAQREGRSKTSDDRTQTALLKMLAMSGTKSPAENLLDLNIVPMAIAYEYDPCDFLKAKEFQQKRDNPDYKKTQADDSINMLTGLLGWKGEIRYTVNGDINSELEEIAQNIKEKNRQLEAIAQTIDRHIHANYKIFHSNEIALDMLLEAQQTDVETRRATSLQSRTYNAADKKAFQMYLQGQIDRVDLPNKDEDFLRSKMLEMYANPLINQLRIKN
jgi:hypothetical protein